MTMKKTMVNITLPYEDLDQLILYLELNKYSNHVNYEYLNISDALCIDTEFKVFYEVRELYFLDDTKEIILTGNFEIMEIIKLISNLDYNYLPFISKNNSLEFKNHGVLNNSNKVYSTNIVINTQEYEKRKGILDYFDWEIHGCSDLVSRIACLIMATFIGKSLFSFVFNQEFYNNAGIIVKILVITLISCALLLISLLIIKILNKALKSKRPKLYSSILIISIVSLVVLSSLRIDKQMSYCVELDYYDTKRSKWVYTTYLNKVFKVYLFDHLVYDKYK